jgi:hypothetical protein
MATATAGVAARDSGVTSATVNTSQQVGGSIGTSLLNTISTSAAASYIAGHLARSPTQRTAIVQAGVVHGYAIAIWWAVGIMVLGALIAGIMVTGKGPHQPTGTERPAPDPAQ